MRISDWCFFFKQKTAYEMRISDWSSDVCSSDLSGRLCTISNSRRTGYGYDQRIEAFGSRGALSVDNIPRTAVRLAAEPGMRPDRIPSAFPERYDAAYRAELNHFAAAIDDIAAPLTGFTDRRAARALADAARPRKTLR